MTVLDVSTPAKTLVPESESEDSLHDVTTDSAISLPSVRQNNQLAPVTTSGVPKFFARPGKKAADRFLEFFVATIRNQNTRRAYAHAAMRFANWCDSLNLTMAALRPSHVAAYIEQMSRDADISPPTVKQHLSALRMLFDWLVIGQILPMNPAASVRGPKYVVTRGKTPVLSKEEARTLLESIDDSTLIGRRDRALIALMIYSFARIGAVVAMNVGDYRQQGKQCWFRLHEKGGKYLELPAHHKAQEFLDSYIELAKIGEDKDSPLFRSFDRKGELAARRLDRRDAYAIVRARAKAAGLGDDICCHTFRATGITVYLSGGGTIEKAQQIAGHESPRTTKLYDRTSEEIDRQEIERIAL